MADSGDGGDSEDENRGAAAEQKGGDGQPTVKKEKKQKNVWKWANPAFPGKTLHIQCSDGGTEYKILINNK